MDKGSDPASQATRQQEKTLAKVQKERDVYAAIIETAGALIIVLDKQGRIISFNRACEDISGYTAKEMKGKHAWDLLIPAEDIESTKAAIAKLGAGNSSLRHENRWVTRDNSWRHIAWNNTALTNDAGEVRYIIGIGIDITDRRATDGELHQRTHDLGERVKELACLYGISRLREYKELTHEQIFKHIVELIPSAWHYPEITAARIVVEDQTFATASFEKTRWMQSSDIVANNQHVGVVEVYYLKRKPKLVEGPFLAEERALIDAIAERLGRVIEVKEQEEKILDYQQQLRQLASELSLSEERERRRLAAILHDQVGQMLALTRIKLGELDETVPNGLLTEITELIDETIQETRSLTIELSPPVLYDMGFDGALEWLVNRLNEKHGISVDFQDDKSLKPLSEDVRVVLFQAVGELLHNVVKHARADQVHVTTSRDGDDISIEVDDNGIGFNSTDVVSRAGKEGKFGLFNIWERLSHIGGNARIVSKVGKGTKVTLIAPLDLGDETKSQAASSEEDITNCTRVRVLLADDHQIIREGLQALLEKHPDIAVVASAASGEDAVRLACEFNPDVVVMDVAMPGMGGIEATKQIVKQLPNTRVIALSMHSDGQFVLEMLRAGAAGYMLKDNAQEDLAHAIRMVNSQLTFISHGIASTVIENYLEHRSKPKTADKAGLTPRELEVLKLLADGLITKQIASQLSVSVKTIEAHRQHIMEKLDMRSIADLTKYAIREGLIKLRP